MRFQTTARVMVTVAAAVLTSLASVAGAQTPEIDQPVNELVRKAVQETITPEELEELKTGHPEVARHTWDPSAGTVEVKITPAPTDSGEIMALAKGYGCYTAEMIRHERTLLGFTWIKIHQTVDYCQRDDEIVSVQKHAVFYTDKDPVAKVLGIQKNDYKQFPGWVAWSSTDVAQTIPKMGEVWNRSFEINQVIDPRPYL